MYFSMHMEASALSSLCSGQALSIYELLEEGVRELDLELEEPLELLEALDGVSLRRLAAGFLSGSLCARQHWLQH